jgi:hypothetical protein
VVGDEVEAQFHRGSKWFPCKITVVNPDGTYALRYNDGDAETDLPAKHIRRPGGGSEGGKKQRFHVGDKVEAQLKGGKKWFAAKIIAFSQVNDDVTYGVRYDDGDIDADVPPERVRRPGARQTHSTGAEESQVSPTDRGVLVEGWKYRLRSSGD